MGFPLETNWYIVEKGSLTRPNVDETRDYVKEDYRMYPMEAELPVILDGECIGMGVVIMTVWASKKTHLKYKLVKRFHEKDPVAIHYTSQYKKAKGGE